MANAPTFADITEVAHGVTGGTSLTATYPSTCTAGQLLVSVVAFPSDPGTITWPSGWTVRKSRTGMTGGGQVVEQHYVLTKVAVGTETNFAPSWTNNMKIGIQALRYNPGNSVISSAFTSDGTWDCLNPAVWTLTAPASGKPALVIYAAVTNSAQDVNLKPASATARGTALAINTGSQTMRVSDILTASASGSYGANVTNSSGFCYVMDQISWSLTVADARVAIGNPIVG